MNTLPTRLPLPSTPSGRRGRHLLELLMHLRPPKTLSFLVALALLPTGCFDPRITGDDGDGSDDGTTAVTTSDGDTTEATTSVEPDSSSGEPLPVCGDGVVEGAEVCDDGVNDGGYGGCNADCTAPGPFCGDGVVNGEEPCDDGDDVDGNGCNVDCVVSGSVLWTVVVDGPDHGTDTANAVAVDSAGNIIVGGNLAIDGSRTNWVAKYTPDGEEAWSTTYCPMSGDCFVYDIAVTPGDDIVVVGMTSDGIDAEDAWIRRYTSDGDIAWTRTYDGPTGGPDSARAVAVDEDGNIYVVIRQNLVDIGNGVVYFVRKFTADGRELWTIYQPADIRINAITMLTTSSFLVVGQQGSSEFWTPWMQEMTSDGGVIWEETHDNHAPGWYVAVDGNSSGDLVLSLSLSGQNDFLIVRATSDGQETWSDSPWGFNSDTQSVTIDDAGWFTCTGGAGEDATLWTRKYQSDGTVAWTDTYNGPEALFGLDQGRDIVRAASGELVTVGLIQDTEGSGTDAWIRKFAP